MCRDFINNQNCVLQILLGVFRIEYPPIPQFYIVKLGYAGADLVVLFLLLGEAVLQGDSDVYPRSKFFFFFLRNFPAIFTAEKKICILHGQAFVMGSRRRKHLRRRSHKLARLPSHRLSVDALQGYTLHIMQYYPLSTFHTCTVRLGMLRSGIAFSCCVCKPALKQPEPSLGF